VGEGEGELSAGRVGGDRDDGESQELEGRDIFT